MQYKEIRLELMNSTWTIRVDDRYVSAIRRLFDRFSNNQQEWIQKEEVHDSIPNIVLAARFIKFTSTRDNVISLYLHILFRETFLGIDNIHVVIGNFELSEDHMKDTIEGYYSIWNICKTNYISLGYNKEEEEQGSGSIIAPYGTALFKKVASGRDSSLSLLASFGGQGSVDDYIKEVRSVYKMYKPLVKEFVDEMSDFLKQESSANIFKRLYRHGLDVKLWVLFPEKTPDMKYMLTVPVCIPVVGLLHLIQIMVMYKTLGLTPGEFALNFRAATGHSQGIAAATALATATDEASFYTVSKKILGILLSTGAFPQLDYPQTSLSFSELSKDRSEDIYYQTERPAFMLSVTRLQKKKLEDCISEFNSHNISSQDDIYLSLINCANTYIVSGKPRSIALFDSLIRKRYIFSDTDQSRIPYSQRIPNIRTRSLSITAPYHCILLENATKAAIRHCIMKGWTLYGEDLNITVRAGDDGHDLKTEGEQLTEYLLKSMCILPVNWPIASDISGITHVIEFGPGGVSGLGSLTYRNIEGKGVPVICADELSPKHLLLGTKADLFKQDMSSIVTAPDWGRCFRPHLVRTKSDGRVHIDTPMSRLLGKPPIMVAGMTPSTISETFVSAVIRAGYHIELSGGGHYNESMLREKVEKILQLVELGQSITINSIYVNPFLWNIQYPLMQKMRQEGVPIDGICIGAGVPTFDVAINIISTIRSVGFRHIGLKPSSVSTIRLVIKIAQANPDFPILLQWTGGRAGGHHSFEDFHQPILETYGSIRAQPNIILVAGSGFGGVDDTLPYLTGEWSCRFECAPMPFDGVLFGSRMMVAKEGQASDAVKEAIVAAQGVDDGEWEKTYKGPAGGIVTVMSELGEPIHKIATRGVMLWKELDDTIFSQNRDKRLELLMAKKEYIIKRLNADFQKPWFGKKTDGRVVDLEEMTYAEVANRLVEVLYIKHQSRWIDVTMRNLVGDYLRRLEERFSTFEHASHIQSFEQINDPFEQIKLFLDFYPECYNQLLTTEDIQFFINLCMRPGQKPVPFIPLIDKDFHIWFKKDSLWQAEDIDAVADQDVGRVCILQGPVSVRYATKANEPAKDILDNIYNGQIKALVERYYDGDESKIPVVDCIGSHPSEALQQSIPSGVTVASTATELIYTMSEHRSALPDNDAWIEALAGKELTWLRAFLTTPVIVQDRKYSSNFIRRVLRPRPGQTVHVHLKDGKPNRVEIIDADGSKALDFSINDNNMITFNMYSSPRSSPCTLEFLFRYNAAMPHAPIYEVMEDRNKRIKRFYAQVWFENSKDGESAIDITDPKQILYTKSQTLSADSILDYCFCTGNGSSNYANVSNGIVPMPIDYAICVSWPTISKCMLTKVFGGNLLKIIYLSNKFRVLDESKHLSAGDNVESNALVTEVVNSQAGCRGVVKCYLYHNRIPVVEITSSFFFREHQMPFEKTFRHVSNKPIHLTLRTAGDAAILRSKEWFIPCMPYLSYIRQGSLLMFKIESQYYFRDNNVFSKIISLGHAMMFQKDMQNWVRVADINYECDNSYGDPVMEYLNRHGDQLDSRYVHMFDNGGYSLIPEKRAFEAEFHAPKSNSFYSQVSGDHNPIHTSPYFSDMVDLPGTITHGMWTSAAMRTTIEKFAADGYPERIRSYKVQFIDIVIPYDKLYAQIAHVGMKNGHKLINAILADSNGKKIIEGQAEISQPRTALLFPGQGAHKVGMGMNLYGESDESRRIWDAADKYMRQKYGIPLIRIVTDNPKSFTVYFGGKKGREIRKVYQSMPHGCCSSILGESLHNQLFPEITDDTESLTFDSPKGLLYATQFTQPAMLLCEIARLEDMKAKGLVSENAMFAGHSLGEYAGLAAVANIFSPEKVAEIGFIRGMIMQRSIKRDTSNRSIYGMVAIDPTKVQDSFRLADLEYVISAIREHIKPDRLLEIVNYNVRDSQYVVSGELVMLETLRLVLDRISESGWNNLALRLLIEDSVSEMQRLENMHGYISQKRGRATIPLYEIEIPFHSSLLYSGTQTFKYFLQSIITTNSIDVNKLRHLYIPNLTGIPFDITKEYFERVFTITGSPFIAEIIKTYDRSRSSHPLYMRDLAYKLLIEILAYQFSFPVRWIETQEALLNGFGIHRFIEIGPGNVLSNMLKNTSKQSAYSRSIGSAIPELEILSVSSDKEKIYYEQANTDINPDQKSKVESIKQDIQQKEGSDLEANITPLPKKATSFESPSCPEKNVAAADIPDEPVSSLEIIRALVALKTRNKLLDVSISKPIKELVGGKSTMQNEIIGDLQIEFGNDMPEKPEEIPIKELAQGMVSFNGALNKHSSGMISRFLSKKMPGGFGRSSICKRLEEKYGLGKSRQDGLLLVAMTMEPPARIGTEEEANMWLDNVASEYERYAGIKYRTKLPQNSSDTINSELVPVINSEEFKSLQISHRQLALKQLDALVNYLGMDTVCKAIGAEYSSENRRDITAMESGLDMWISEHGEFYANNIRPMFSPKMARFFNSSWNWVIQDILSLFNDIVSGRITKIDISIAPQCLHLENRLTEDTLDILRYLVQKARDNNSKGYNMVVKYGAALLSRCQGNIQGPPLYKYTSGFFAPSLIFDHNGEPQYKEIIRSGTSRIDDYVCKVTGVPKDIDTTNVHSPLCTPDSIKTEAPTEILFSSTSSKFESIYNCEVGDTPIDVLESAVSSLGSISTPSFYQLQDHSYIEQLLPFVHIRSKGNRLGDWKYDVDLTEAYARIMHNISDSGISFSGKKVLITGCGKGSIGSEILKGLLEGGANVIVTTSSYSHKTSQYYQEIYQCYGSRGSSLHVVPFNQASRQDVEELVEFIYGNVVQKQDSPLGWDLDFIIPFAAISVVGCEIDGLGSQAELALRAMMTNVFRLLGSIAKQKERHCYDNHPTLVVLPLSPNHGVFGGDGFYGESKASLETLLSRWESESWSEYLSVTGAVIGWTRGTGLMDSNNIVAEAVERLGIRTFSASEIAFNILSLLHPRMYSLSALKPIWADMSGRFGNHPNQMNALKQIRATLNSSTEIIKMVSADRILDHSLAFGHDSARAYYLHKITPRANRRIVFPRPKSFTDLKHLHYLQGLINLDKVVVITGYGEVGPFGNSDTRWEMESYGEFSLEGCIELAWIMGYIKYFNGKHKGIRGFYTGWVDSKTDEPVADIEVKGRYEKQILAHTGIRLIDPQHFGGYDPNKKPLLHEIQLEQDMDPFETTLEEAQRFKLRNDKHVRVNKTCEGTYCVRFLKGATVMVPKALRFDRLVAAQVPTGWDPTRYGIPKSISDQVDQVTCYAVVATVEALVRSGITDPYEIFKYVHVSEIGSATGSGIGGLQSIKKTFVDRFCDQDHQADIFQEAFITTPPAWINMLLLSASGPIKTAVGACATSVVSIDIAVDTIQAGKAKIMLAGGVDSICEESMFEFAKMNATSNTVDEASKGRAPAEMSRPCTATRSGFMESEGSGVILLMSATTALEMGVPIYGIIAMAGTATDKEGRSIPAPGQGVLTSAREVADPEFSHLIDIEYRRCQIERRMSQVKEWIKHEYNLIGSKLRGSRSNNTRNHLKRAEEELLLRKSQHLIEWKSTHQIKESQETWGNNFWKGCPHIAPLRGCLAVWGLSVDDIDVVSFHGTSTKANDKNESDIVNAQLKHLGRTPGNIVPVICQKYLTGHPKGAAAAWMLNGIINSLNSGLIPGNRNADNISEELKQFSYLFYPSRTYRAGNIKAALLKSFGFGQVGGELLIIHPDYLFATQSFQELEEYRSKIAAREAASYRHWHNSLTGVHPFVQIKNSPPYTEDQEKNIYLDPTARAQYSNKDNAYNFESYLSPSQNRDHNTNHSDTGFGVDCFEAYYTRVSQDKPGVCINITFRSDLDISDEQHVSELFTSREQTYCYDNNDTEGCFLRFLCIKEAAFESISSHSSIRGACDNASGTVLRDIEVQVNAQNHPTVSLGGMVREIAQKEGITELTIYDGYLGKNCIAMVLTSIEKE